jgi:hypothetical protein
MERWLRKIIKERRLTKAETPWKRSPATHVECLLKDGLASTGGGCMTRDLYAKEIVHESITRNERIIDNLVLCSNPPCTTRNPMLEPQLAGSAGLARRTLYWQ